MLRSWQLWAAVAEIQTILQGKLCRSTAKVIISRFLNHMFFDCPFLVKTRDSCEAMRRPVAIFLPHEWFAWACNAHGELEAEAAELLIGWSHVKSFWKEHLKLKDPRVSHLKDAAGCVPLLLHGDGGSFQRYDSINVISFRSLLSTGNVAHSQMMLAAIPKSSCKDQVHSNLDTMTQVWKAIVWSFQCLFKGVYPSKDHLGNPLSSKTAVLAGKSLSLKAQSCNRGFVFGFTGDGEWFQNEYKLLGASFNNCCFSCKANKSNIPHNDFREAAAWRSTIVDHHAQGYPTEHAISKIPGTSGYSFAYDSLHILEEGVSAHCVANCFFLILS